MQSTENNNSNTNLHPVEESVLAIATGNIVQQTREFNEDLSPASNREESFGNATVEVESAHLQKLKAVSKSINETIVFAGKHILGRDEIIRQTFMAFMTGEHQLLISKTGMAKSLLARQIFSCFAGANIFEKQLTKDTMPENLFGAYDLEAMKKGKMIHNVEGSIVLSHFAFLDEIFDANDMVLRALLSILNEKQLINGEQIVHSTLHSAIAAANYIRTTEILEAVIDRFLYKSFIPENKGLYFKYSIDHVYQEHFGRISAPEKRLSLGELSFVKKIIQSKKIEIPGYVLFLKNYILKKYIEETRNTVSEKKDFTISDRTSVKLQDTLRALAILDGRHKVEEQDIEGLHYAACTIGRDDEKTRFDKISTAARNYFRQDKGILENIFEAIEILNIIKASGNGETLKSNTTFNRIKIKLERAAKKESSVFKEYFNKLKQKLMALSSDLFIPETFSVLENICETSLKDVRAKESREIISGFREDVFNEKKIAIFR